MKFRYPGEYPLVQDQLNVIWKLLMDIHRYPLPDDAQKMYDRIQEVQAFKATQPVERVKP